MLRIRTGARYGLRWGMFGFVAAVVSLSNSPTQAAPYADIVVDANSGTVLHSTNPDARRHPASLTKIMTLYLLFEQLEAGKLKLDSPLKVSAEAAGQTPTKLGLKPGSTLAVEDAIKGMVTRSANDAAVVVAEAIAGDEGEFAKLMTRKAKALGMGRTVYKNASGLPNDDQVTTARDQAALGRAIQERFPRYYKYFSIRSFTFRGQSIANHNHLLGRVEGVDGIKTGYINASGFNLVTSVHRGNRYLVAVVMGGSSGGSRDARMRELINDKIAQASTKRTAPMVAENGEAPELKPEPKAVAKLEPKAEPKVADKAEPKSEPKAAAKAEPRFAVASAASVPVRINPSSAQAEPAAMRSEPTGKATAQPQIAAGSTEPIRPVLVKTLTVRARTQTASLAPLHLALPIAELQPIPAAPAAVVATNPEPAAPAAAPGGGGQARAGSARGSPGGGGQARAGSASTRPSGRGQARADGARARAGGGNEARAGSTGTRSGGGGQARGCSARTRSGRGGQARTRSARPRPRGGGQTRAASARPRSGGESRAAGAAARCAPWRVGRIARRAVAAAAPAPASVTPPAKPQHRSGWMIQVGAYPAEQAAKQRLTAVQSKASKMLTGAEAFTETVEKGGTTFYRARFAGLDKDKAEAACKYLKKNDVECVTIKN